MAQLSGTNLFTLPAAGTQGWNSQYDDNLQEIRDRLGNIIEIATNNDPGDATVAHAAAATAVAPTINTVTGTGDDATINANFASNESQINALIADNADLRAQLNALLAALRTTTGMGALDG